MPYLPLCRGRVLFFLILFMVVRPLIAMLVASEPISAAAETPACRPPSARWEAAISGKQPAQILTWPRNNPANTAVVVKLNGSRVTRNGFAHE